MGGLILFLVALLGVPLFSKWVTSSKPGEPLPRIAAVDSVARVVGYVLLFVLLASVVVPAIFALLGAFESPACSAGLC